MRKLLDCGIIIHAPPFSDLYFSKVFGKQILNSLSLDHKLPLNVLDFGCGPGYLFENLISIKSNWFYTGVDFSSDSILKLNEKFGTKEKFLGGHFIKSIPTDLQSDSYDVVLLIEVVEHLNDQHLSETLQEAFRLLKNGGALIVSTPNQENLFDKTIFCPDCGAVFHQWQHIRSWSASTLTDYLGRYGFILHKSNALDFNLQPCTPINLLKRIRSFFKGILTGAANHPHLIANFKKDL